MLWNWNETIDWLEIEFQVSLFRHKIVIDTKTTLHWELETVWVLGANYINIPLIDFNISIPVEEVRGWRIQRKYLQMSTDGSTSNRHENLFFRWNGVTKSMIVDNGRYLKCWHFTILELGLRQRKITSFRPTKFYHTIVLE